MKADRLAPLLIGMLVVALILWGLSSLAAAVNDLVAQLEELS